MNFPFRLRWVPFIALAMLGFASLACTWSLIDFSKILSSPTVTPGANPQPGPSATPVALAEVTFSVSIPAALNPGESLAIGIMDEVTGLGLNPTLYAIFETLLLFSLLLCRRNPDRLILFVRAGRGGTTGGAPHAAASALPVQ